MAVNLWAGLYVAPNEWPWTYSFLIMIQSIYTLHPTGHSLGFDALARTRPAALGWWSRLIAVASWAPLEGTLRPSTGSAARPTATSNCRPQSRRDKRDLVVAIACSEAQHIGRSTRRLLRSSVGPQWESGYNMRADPWST